MGGHSAWRKRVAAGELAKGSGGAICRHRPHLGRKGKDREVERKGNINGGPRKKKRNKAKLDRRLALSDPKEGEDQTTHVRVRVRVRDFYVSFVTLVFQIFLVLYLLSFLYQVLVFNGRFV